MSSVNSHISEHWRHTRLEPLRQEFTWRDTVLYALAIGVGSQSPGDASDLRFVQGSHAVPLPTFVTTLATTPRCFGVARTAEPVAQVLLSQSLTLHSAVPAQGCVVSEETIEDAYETANRLDAIVRTRRTLHLENGPQIATMSAEFLIRGLGGFGGPRARRAPHPALPARAPDLVAAVQTAPNQALLFQLTGDTNPLHVDPASALAQGFDRPVLHGLSSYGAVGRILLQRLCDDSVERVVSLESRFARPVFPGDLLHVEAWHVADGEAAFRALVPARSVVVQSCGRFTYQP